MLDKSNPVRIEDSFCLRVKFWPFRVVNAWN